MKSCCFLAILGCFLTGSLPAQEPVFRPHDFYYYESSGNAKGLLLAPKLLITFKPDINEQEQIEYFIAFDARIAPIVKIEHRFVRQVVVSLNVAEWVDLKLYIVDVIARASLFEEEKKIAVIQPVFIKDGQESFLTSNILVETKTSINYDLLKSRLDDKDRALGKFDINFLNKTARPHVYEIRVANLQWPPNVLTLANLISEQPWAEYAQPIFQDLAAPITVHLQVFPDGAPTLGERRVLVARITVNDVRYRLQADLLPELGQGEFLPRGTGMVDEVFFSVSGELKNTREFQEGNRRVIEVSWPFYIFSPGQYTLGPVNIPYKAPNDNGLDEDGLIASDSATISVNSIIDHSPVKIDDIQAILPYNRAELFNRLSQSWESRPADWLAANRYWLSWLLIASGLVLVGIMVTAVGGYRFKAIRSRNYEWRQKLELCRRLSVSTTLIKLKGVDAYAQTEKLLRQVAQDCFSLPYNLPDGLEDGVGGLFKSCLSELGNRFQSDYHPEMSTLDRLCGELEQLAVLARQRMGG